MYKYKKIRPLFNQIIVTADCYTEDDYDATGTLLLSTKGTLKSIQKVVAIGDCVRNFKVGDTVHLNPVLAYRGLKQNRGKENVADTSGYQPDIEGANNTVSYELPEILINDTPHILLSDRDVDYVVEDYEEVYTKPKSRIYIPKLEI